MSNSEKGNQQRRSQDHNNRGAPRPQQLNNNLSTANGTQRGGGSSRDNQPSNNRSERGGNGGRQGKAGSSSSSSVWAHTSPSSSSASASASIATSTPNNTPNPTNSTGGITIAKRNVTDILKNAFTSPSSGTASKDSSSTEAVKIHASRDLEVYGVILSIRGSFGFIQAIFEDEQFYYSDREFYDNMKVGDRVAFLPRTSPKGPSAQNVRFLIPTLSKIVGQFSGVITRSPERHRSGCGLIEIDVTTLTSVGQDVKQVLEQKFKKTISFRPVDIATASIPKNHFLDKGDGVEFSIAKMHDSNLYLATEVKFKQLKRDRLISMQIQRMLEAGAVREVGVVTTLKNKEYGFIRAQDRKDELYFRMDDIADENQEIEEVRIEK